MTRPACLLRVTQRYHYDETRQRSHSYHDAQMSRLTFRLRLEAIFIFLTTDATGLHGNMTTVAVEDLVVLIGPVQCGYATPRLH